MFSKMILQVVVFALAASQGLPALAVSPASAEQGRQLFERKWKAGNPAIASDGLGPLFNGQSCVACHHQGGVGGGGDSRFNAKTLGIETMTIAGGAVTDDVIATMVRSFHPGFVQASGAISNTLTLPHHGGSELLIQARRALLSQVPATFSDHGGPTDAEETRRSYATPILFNNKIGPHQISLRARLFHRNTTSLFGSGQIDQVSEKEIDAQVKLQKRYPEISGRPSTLDDGRYGKFGWRANVASLLEFNDQACANEVGLETKRKPQARDAMNPAYRNPAIDISDAQIRTMTRFVAALPAPVRVIPSDTQDRLIVQRGEQAFAEIGCSICHVPDMGPAKGIYSDILLHDMGYESIDLNSAEPYIVRATPASNVTLVSGTRQVSGTATSYYGRSSSMSINETTSLEGGSRRTPQRNHPVNTYRFVAPSGPTELLALIPIRSEQFEFTTEGKSSGGGWLRGDFTVKTQGIASRNDYIRAHYERTNFNQEWRTPPLWGVRDSAPYMHDGRAATLLEAIAMHEGEAAGTRDRFLALPLADRRAMIAFLNTLVAPPNAPPVAM